jgi:hypothetical protein
VPDPLSDIDQLRFVSIRSRMLDSAAKSLPTLFLEQSKATSREDLRAKLCESVSIMAIIDCCAYEALRIEEERKTSWKK